MWTDRRPLLSVLLSAATTQGAFTTIIPKTATARVPGFRSANSLRGLATNIPLPGGGRRASTTSTSNFLVGVTMLLWCRTKRLLLHTAPPTAPSQNRSSECHTITTARRARATPSPHASATATRRPVTAPQQGERGPHHHHTPSPHASATRRPVTGVQ